MFRWQRMALIFCLLGGWLTACQAKPAPATPTLTSTLAERSTSTSIPSATSQPTSTFTPTTMPSTPSPTAAPLLIGASKTLGRGTLIDGAFLPDASGLVVGWAAGLSFIQLPSGKESWYVSGPSALIKLDMNAQGQQVAAVFTDGSQMIVDIATGQVHRFPSVSPDAAVWGALAWSPDGKQVAYQLTGNTRADPIYLLNAATGQVSKVPNSTISQGDPPSLVWSPDGKTISETGLVGGLCPKILDVATGTEILSLGKSGNCLAQQIVGWTPDGADILAVDSQGNLLMVSFPDGNTIRKIDGVDPQIMLISPGKTVIFSPDGSLAASYIDSTYYQYQNSEPITLWDVKTGRRIAR